jgi:hypothetical protein
MGKQMTISSILKGTTTKYLAILLLGLISAQDYKDLDLGELSRNNRIESDETKFFRLKVPSREYEVEKDLVIKVFSEG